MMLSHFPPGEKQFEMQKFVGDLYIHLKTFKLRLN